MALSNFSKLNLKPEFITLSELILWLSSNNWLLSPKIIFTILAGIFGRKIDLFNLFPSNLTSSDCGIGFGDNALKFTIVFSMSNSFNLHKVKSDLRFSMNKFFNENNIEIPYPQRTVNIINPTN